MVSTIALRRAASLLAGCGLETAGSAATGGNIKAREAEEAKKAQQRVFEYQRRSLPADTSEAQRSYDEWLYDLGRDKDRYLARYRETLAQRALRDEA